MDISDISEILNGLFGDQPFLDGKTAGRQGAFYRHMFMSCAVQVAVNRAKPFRMMEIGCWTGNSALTWSQAIRRHSTRGGEILCIDPWGLYLAQGDKVGSANDMDFIASMGLAYGLFLHNTQSIEGKVKLSHIRGTIDDVASDVAKFDLIYVDGAHAYDPVMNDLTRAADLLRDGGILCGDDLERQCGFDGVTEEFLETNKNAEWSSEFGGFHPGVSLAVHRFFKRLIFAKMGFWAVRKNGAVFEDANLVGTTPMIPDHFTPELKERCRRIMEEQGVRMPE